MSFLYHGRNIEEKRVLVSLETLYRTITELKRLELRAERLIDYDLEAQEIYELSNGVLPNKDSSGNVLDLVLRWGDVNFDSVSKAKFVEYQTKLQETNNPNATIVDEVSTVKKFYNLISSNILLNVAEVDDFFLREFNPDERIIIDGIRVFEAWVSLKQIEKYDYDYESHGILHELYKITELLLESTEKFYSHFYYQSYGQFIEKNVSYDDSGSIDRMIYVYDTSDIDHDLETNVFPVIFDYSNSIPDKNRELLRVKYGELRDRILFFCMSLPSIRTSMDADSLYNYIFRVGERRTGIFDNLTKLRNDLLFCLNGLKKFDAQQYVGMREEELYFDPMPFNELIIGSTFWFSDRSNGTKKYVKIGDNAYRDNLGLVYDLDYFTEGDMISVHSDNDPKTKRRHVKSEEEVFFPFHNQTVLIDHMQSSYNTTKSPKKSDFNKTSLSTKFI